MKGKKNMTFEGSFYEAEKRGNNSYLFFMQIY